MTNSQNDSIGLSELIEQVKAELLTPPKNKTAPFLFVESVELELQVTVKKAVKGGIKIDVLSFGGAEAGGGIDQDKIQKVKVQLSPLYSKDEMKRYCQELRPEAVLPSINNSLKAIIKGKDSGDEGVV
ncbi:MAG: trypco2 family protein [Xenococcaceae cyanobacterium]